MSENFDEELEEIKRRKMEELMEKQKKSFPDSPIELSDNNFYEVVEEYPLVVVDFWAEWCAPCKAMNPVIKKLASKYSGKVVFGKVDIDKNSGIPQKFQISGVPTLLIWKDGEMVDRVVGMVPPQELENKITSYLD